MKLFDEFIRQENFSRFRQKSRLAKPKMGVDDKKLIADAKSFREIEKLTKQQKTKKLSMRSEDVVNKKKKIKAVHKENEGYKNDNLEDLIYTQVNIFDKLKNCKEKDQTDTERSKTEKLKKLLKALEKPIKRFFLIKLALNTLSQISSSLSFMQEDNEVQLIMSMQNL